MSMKLKKIVELFMDVSKFMACCVVSNILVYYIFYITKKDICPIVNIVEKDYELRERERENLHFHNE